MGVRNNCESLDNGAAGRWTNPHSSDTSKVPLNNVGTNESAGRPTPYDVQLVNCYPTLNRGMISRVL